MKLTAQERAALATRIIEIRSRLQAIEEQLDWTEWKLLYNEMIAIQRQLQESQERR